MPELSRFLGIVVSMNYDDHAPPHFHVRYAGREASIAIRPLQVLGPGVPPRVLGLVLEWAALHQKELLVDWDLAERKLPLRRIKPLE
jgi:hypothetical protein